MSTTRGPLPLEKKIAHIALKASMKGETEKPSPLEASEPNLIKGAEVYRVNCAVCHGIPNQNPSAIAQGLFPPAPQLMPPHKGVTDDSIGEIYWKVKNGIRFTGMPGFSKTLSDTEMWQVSELLLHADKISQDVKNVLEKTL